MKKMDVIRLVVTGFLLLTVLTLSSFAQSTGASAKAENDISEPSSELRAIVEKLKPEGLLNDFGNYFDESLRQEIESDLESFRSNKNIDFAVVVVRSTEGQSIDDFSLQLARKWKVGAAKGGILLLIAVEDRGWRIQIDRTLEKSLTSEQVKKIGDKMIPALKEKNYAEAIKRCIQGMTDELGTSLKRHTHDLGVK